MSAKGTASSQFLGYYNLLSALGWGYILLRVVLSILMFRDDPAHFYQSTRNVVTAVQCCATMEIVNSALGLVRSPLFTTVAQVFSRLLIVIGVFQYLPETALCSTVVYKTLLVAWSTTEIVRYWFYYKMLQSPAGPPKFIKWLRYNMFIVLYPLGVASELLLLFSSLDVAATKYGPSVQYVIVASMLLYIPGLPILFKHMLRQRRKSNAALRAKQQ
ncbi:enoyl-CoA hydratase PHS1 KNAG_0B01760 [Huiozyma naganishii CBS 8797]|uniref:Very-long-chain (3R)-3-hydroxyacyl-CoA dehydratase n=1 Tax=Huiozyma naganishii (strain ATCC MYA-139 / BCRC 22969 / CBS 8797 / KCTC 17520 / NBRC 10181 / NCYC 3082 / Yp74L-3) TaxID=1071383 RepID=J7S3B0_HUIN7|nr:hypothetical protein KNAG_0B01760 [Kazachstania naganishii CBS 8797]CCK68619.1 hypothetical protein KNAG_0B01760 [Kazachstania naganishii CBS 8797]